MLVKRIDLGSIPIGLYKTGEDIPKGSAVILKDGEIFLPSTKPEAENILGFATLTIDFEDGGDIADHNILEAGKRVVVYTLVKSNMWGTTEFIDATFTDGDDISVAYAGTDKGKLIKSGVTAGVDDAAPLFTFFEKGMAGSYPLLDVYVK